MQAVRFSLILSSIFLISNISAADELRTISIHNKESHPVYMFPPGKEDTSNISLVVFASDPNTMQVGVIKKFEVHQTRTMLKYILLDDLEVGGSGYVADSAKAYKPCRDDIREVALSEDGTTITLEEVTQLKPAKIK